MRNLGPDVTTIFQPTDLGEIQDQKLDFGFPKANFQVFTIKSWHQLFNKINFHENLAKFGRRKTSQEGLDCRDFVTIMTFEANFFLQGKTLQIFTETNHF